MGELKFVAFRKVRAFVSGARWNSLGLTLPAEAVRKLGWRDGDLVQIWYDEDHDAIILVRIRRPHADPAR